MGQDGIDGVAFADVLDDEDRAVVAAAGYGQPMGFGDRPALLVVDVTYGFVGRERLPLLESIARHRRSCGERAWAAVDQIARMLSAARDAGVPVLYSVMTQPSDPHWVPGLWSTKNRRSGEDRRPEDPGRGENDIVAEIAPLPTERVYAKNHPSFFADTEALGQLRDEGVDSVVICGGATSGCVRATTVDAFSAGLKAAVVADACFDRLKLAHQVNLLDIDLKYGDVVTADQWIAELKSSTKID